MATHLVERTFRHINGQPARHIQVQIVNRGTSAPVLQTLTTNELGFAWTYIDVGQYDWLALGARIPFDVESNIGAAEQFVHTQGSAAAQWTINHDRGGRPAVVLMPDSDPGERVYTDLTYVSDSQILVTWPSPVSGKAYIP